MNEGTGERRPRTARWRWIALGVAWTVPVVVLLVIGWFFEPSPLRYDPPQPKVIAVRYHEAEAALEAGDLAGAQAKLEALRTEDPVDPLVHALLGQVYRQQGKLPEAMAATRMALGLDPGLGEAQYNLATDLVRRGQLENGLRALRLAAVAGLDVRTPARNDPDLAALGGDPRMQVYLEGASTIPLTDRSASIRYEPQAPGVGQPFTLVIEILALNQPVKGTALPVSVTFTGPAEIEVLVPVSSDSRVVSSQDGERMRYRWTYRYELLSRARFAGQIGPWEVQIGGVEVPLDNPSIVIDELSAPADSAGRDEAGREVLESIPAFRPGEFFNRPSASAPGPVEGVRVELLPSGGAWSSSNIGLTIVPYPVDGGSDVDAHFDAGLAPLASYDERRPGSGDDPGSFRRIYAFAPEVMPLVRRAPVSVRVGSQRYQLRIQGAPDENGAPAAPAGAPAKH